MLLTCHLPYITDGSSNNYSFTSLSNAPEAVPFGPYDYVGATVTDGGSIYFDGSGTSLETPSASDFSFGTGDFTVECWFTKDTLSHKGIWQISATAGGLNSSNYANTLALGYQSGMMQIYGGGNSTTASAPITVNNWFHAAYVRSSGVSKLYINGTEIISQSDTNDYNLGNVVIGAYYNPSYHHNGKISDFRVVKGTAVYTSNFTPPASPLTAITNTKLLLKGEGSKLFDKSQSHNFTLNGTGTGYATASDQNARSGFPYHIKLPNTQLNDEKWVGVAPSRVFNFGTGDFTVEAFIWSDTVPANQERYLFDFKTNGFNMFSVGGRLKYYNNSTSGGSVLYTTGFGVLSTGAWHYIAASRVSGTTRLYANGTLTASDTDNKNFNDLHTKELSIGAYASSGYNWNGYISNFRITNGLGRYSGSSMTVPTEPFQG